MRWFSFILLTVMAVAMSSSLIAGPDNPDPKEMVRKADLLLRGDKSSIQFAELIVIRPSQKIERKLTVYLKEKQFTLTHILEPSKDRDTTFLKRGDDLWTYTPNVRKVIRIPATMMHNSFMGSDFTYDDIVKAATLADDYDPKILGLSDKMPEEHGKVYVLDLTPLPGRAVSYKKLRVWIREKDSILLRQQFYDEQLKVTRVMNFSDIREIGGRVMPTEWHMFNVEEKGNSTIYRILKAEFDTITDESMFEQRVLSSPPAAPWDK